MAGNRVGYLVGPPELVHQAHKVGTHTAYHAPVAGQLAAQRALEVGADWVENARALYREAGSEAAKALEAAMTYFGELPSTHAPAIGGALTLALGQNRPNPFRGETKISFTVPGEFAVIDLSIYDLAGRRVRSLLSGRVPGGAYTERWDGLNEQGRHVASGVYFYRLKGEDRKLTKKLVLLR